MVKPHMVKKWARPGTVHCRSLRWPATSTVSASTLRLMGPRTRFGSFFPERMSLDSQWNRRAAMPKPMTVTARPMMILTGTNAPRLSQIVKQERWRSASATWDFDAAQRIVGPPHLGVVGVWTDARVRRRLLDARAGPSLKPRLPRPGAPLAPSRGPDASIDGSLSRQPAFAQRVDLRGSRGRSSEAEHQLPKLRTRVRFPSPALFDSAGRCAGPVGRRHSGFGTWATLLPPHLHSWPTGQPMTR